MADEMVLETQQWLNNNYGNVPGFEKVKEDGKTGWPTIYASFVRCNMSLVSQNSQTTLGLIHLIDLIQKSCQNWKLAINQMLYV